jgi:hypothetical protein
VGVFYFSVIHGALLFVRMGMLTCVNRYLNPSLLKRRFINDNVPSLYLTFFSLVRGGRDWSVFMRIVADDATIDASDTVAYLLSLPEVKQMVDFRDSTGLSTLDISMTSNSPLQMI